MGSEADIRLMAGAEVYYFQGMGKAERLPDLCIEGTDTILVEMPFVQWTEDIYRDIRTIIEDRQLTVVLAHIERYPEFQKSDKIWNKVMDLPLVTQLNAGSYLKGWRKRKFCLNWIKERPSSVLGSDCHNLTTRRPNLKAAREVIEKKAGAEALKEIDRTAAKLLGIYNE
jgi:protein-tyrosine phosphatase